MNWRKWQAGKKVRSAKARRAAVARWAAYHAAREGEPVRRTRVVEMTIRDSCRMMRVIRLESDEGGRWLVSENGVRVGSRRLGARRLAGLIAESLK